jgi:seryl-tRNA synthetase
MPEHTMILEGDARVPDYLTGELQSRLAYVDERLEGARVAPDGHRVALIFRRLPDPAGLREVEAKVLRVLEAMVHGAVRPREKVLEDRLDRPVPGTVDPLPALTERGEVFSETTGVAVLGPLLARLMDFFERAFLDLAQSFGAIPYRFPTLISAALLDRVEYFRSFPHSITFASHLRPDLDVIEGFSAAAKIEEDALHVDPASFSRPTTVLSPAVCFHYYGALSGTRLREGVCATAVGNCFRYESSNLVSLERLWNFTMREIIFVGAKDFVLERREEARQRVAPLLEAWGFAYRVEGASDPFFVGEFKRQTAFQSAFQLKYEIRAKVPHRHGTLAVGSYNFHQDFFGRHLDIRLEDGTPANTGCVAFGLERLAYAFLAQYGLDPVRWPEAVRHALAS